MSDYSALFAGLTQEQQLYLQQQNARLMMIRSMNQSSSGTNPSLHSSQSASMSGSTSNATHNSQSLKLPSLDASPPKVAPTGYYLRRQNDASSSQAPQIISASQGISNSTAVHDIPQEGTTEQPQHRSQSELHPGQLHQTVQSSADLNQQRLLQQQIQHLQQQYQLQLQAQQHQQQVQAQRQQQIQQDMEDEKLRQMRVEEPKAAGQKSPQAQHQRQSDPSTFSSVRVSSVSSALPKLDAPNLLSLLVNPDPSLTPSTFIVFWRQTAHTRREIMSKPPLWRSQKTSIVLQQPASPRGDHNGAKAVSVPSVPPQLSSAQSVPKGAEQLLPEAEDIHVPNAAYFKVSLYFLFFITTCSTCCLAFCDVRVKVVPLLTPCCAGIQFPIWKRGRHCDALAARYYRVAPCVHS
jgi:hypothetical protein